MCKVTGLSHTMDSLPDHKYKHQSSLVTRGQPRAQGEGGPLHEEISRKQSRLASFSFPFSFQPPHPALTVVQVPKMV